MSRNRTEAWVTKKGFSILNKHKKVIIDMAESGSTIKSISSKFEVVPSSIINKLREWGVYDKKIKCALIECKKTFKFTPGKKCCSRLHIKRLCSRKPENNVFVKCRLPECDKHILKAKKVYCSRSHCETHNNRIKTGFYDRLRNRSPSCMVCGEWRVLDSHHVDHKKGKSDKNSSEVWLCPTHHLAIHRRLAYIDKKDLSYNWLDEKIIDNL